MPNSRDRGAILIGKTQTTAFAYMTPGPTRNPRNVEHTPGGSSSGSAAAVAAGMVPLALGTQTKGSVLRPASYCGVTGFKPTFGAFSMKGVLPFAKSLDTLGFFTHTPADMRALWRALGRDSDGADVSVLGAPSPTPTVEAPMAAAFNQALVTMQQAGVSVRFINIAAMLAKLADAAHVVMSYEAARFHQAALRGAWRPTCGPRRSRFNRVFRFQSPDTTARAGISMPAGRRWRSCINTHR